MPRLVQSIPKVIQARDFTDDASTGDIFGHGTHVAGIAAGTRVLSGDQYTGVAPGAFLWNAKVLNSQGFGFNSWIIAGIEFAALGPDGVAGTDDEADVINMSLGASVNGDGSDPLSLAVDFATGQGLVVAVAAGNSGPDMFSVGQPAVSRTAITVGATNDFDQMAGFSSRGPTLDLRIKPDVTGPGVAIRSTRAGGGYVRFNGTSMATPHVAGAAGLILQAHPDWDPMMVKAALMNNALVLGGPRLWDQGAGRIRVPQAVNTTLMAMEPSFSFGELTSGDLVTADLTVRNLTGVEATVNLTTFTTVDGVVTSDLVTVVPAGLTIPASGSAVATLTVGPVGAAPQGWYEGRITVSGDHDSLTVPYLFRLAQNPEIQVTPDAISGDGTFLESVTRTLTITNTGQSDLTFAMGVALVEQVGAAEAALPASQARNWVTEKKRIAASRSDGSRPVVTEAPAGPQQLAPIIQDPEGDSGVPNVDILRLDGGTHGATATLQIFFSDAAAFGALLGYVHLDVDQNPLTGVPPGDWFGLPEQDIGADFVLVVESSSDVGPAVNVLTLTLVDAVGRNVITNLPGEYVGTSILVAIPLSLLGQDDGLIDITMVMGDFAAPGDWAPSAGHGSIGTPAVPWICTEPSTGVVPPQGSRDVTVTLNCLRDLAPGAYNADIIIRSNDPDNDQVIVPAALEVGEQLPPEIDVTPASFAEALAPGQLLNRTMNISNIVGTGSGGVLTFDITLVDQDTGQAPTWLSVSPSDGFVDPGETLPAQITFDATDLPAGVHNAQVTIANNDADENPVTVSAVLTVENPEIEVSPAFFSVVQDRDRVTTADLVITNSGDGTLTFDITVAPTRPAAGSGGSNGPLGAGGPDLFGYSWTDISATGIPIGAGDDSQFTIPIGFGFEFYGTVYDTAYVGTNGILGFSSSGMSDLSNQLLPDPSTPNNLVSAFWDDLRVQTSNRLLREVVGQAPNRKLVVEWFGVTEYGNSGASHTFEVILEERTGNVLVQYLSMNGDLDSATVGIENATGDDGLTANFNALCVHNELSVLFSTGQLFDFASVEPATGYVAPGESVDVTVTFDSTDLDPGVYTADIVINNNDPDEDPTVVTGSLTVPPPDIEVSPLAVDVGILDRGCSTADLTITNTGDGTLIFEIPGVDGTITAAPAAGSVAPGGSLSLVLTVCGAELLPGVHQLDMVILSNDPDEGEVIVAVSFIVPPPDIGVAPDSFTLTQDRDQVTTADLTITNTGDGILVFDMTVQLPEQAAAAAVVVK